MFCLRSWLPLLFIPTNASPIFVLTFFLLTYYLNRPCVYCSILLGILFASSCYWSESCWFDGSSSLSSGISGNNSATILAASNNGTATGYNWFEPRYISGVLPNLMPPATTGGNAMDGSVSEIGFLGEVLNSTAVGLAGAMLQGVQKSGIGLGWARTLLGGAEWRVPFLDVNVRL